MARQDGVILLKGQLGGLSFYKTAKDGHLARQKGGVDAKRIRTEAAFARTRENGSEFGRAGQAGRLLRTAFRALLLNSSDSRTVSRLTQKFTEVIHADTTSARGARNVVDGDMSLLQGFEFNIDGKLRQTLLAQYSVDVNRATGLVTINVPQFVPAELIAAPIGATNFRLVASVSELDFAADRYNSEVAESEENITGLEQPVTINLPLEVAVGTTSPLVVVLGIEFSQVVNGAMYAINDGAYNALAVVAVDAEG
ncbi:hypothetical protein [Parachryseolinea silvisoli]|jgi:hypothetical protein|uniref:hypothetical protein n=1 Tax=Parachryseolinea silvisoli TaxID=2873601 RepID=UPI0022659FB4|nr:hypothetical protein [Parachryseolinea silvisoli]MCD9013982.1 hypothetical protein [Parachryseolinea silvisoli]